MSLAALEKKIGHRFHDSSLLQSALTHSSSGQRSNYERLEFLGDRVLGLIIAQALFQKFPEENEGDLAKRLAALVQGSMLATIASAIQLGDHILLSDAEKSAGGAANENILADVFEAMLGALYLDGGFAACERLVTTLWADHFYDMKTPPLHPKTAVQEWAQAKGLPLPLYEVVAQHGPDHAPVFVIRLTVAGHAPVQAEGRSRQAAEKEAAAQFLTTIGHAV